MPIATGMAGVESIKASVVMTYCGCSRTKQIVQRLLGIWHTQHKQPCTTPRLIDDLGVVGEYHRGE